MSGRPIEAAQAERRGYSRHYVDRDPVRFESPLLFAAAAEHVGIAALEANDVPAGLSLAQQDGIDVCLLRRRLSRGLAHRDAYRVATRVFENVGADQPVMDDDVRFLAACAAP